MIPNYRICDCCGKEIRLDDEWSGHTAHCAEVPVFSSSDDEGCCLIDFVFEVHSKGSSRTVVPHDCKADLCDDCKLKLLENAISTLKKYRKPAQ